MKVNLVSNPIKTNVFIHIPKCAGTSFSRQLRRAYGKENVFVANPSSTPKLLAGKGIDGFSSFKFVCGHFLASDLVDDKKKKPNFMNWLTILRDPVQRLKSAYNFYLSMDLNLKPDLKDSPVYQAVLRNDNLYHFARSLGEDHRNLQAKCITVKKNYSSSQELMKSSLRSLKNDFLLVGLTEEMNKTVMLASILLNLKKMNKALKVNVSEENYVYGRHKKIESISVSKDDENNIRDLNSIDCSLYSEGKKIFRALCKKHNLN